MLDVVIAAVQAGTEEEPAKELFYIVGGLLAAWAVILGALGISRHASFPPSRQAAGGIIAVSAVLVAGTMLSAVLTS